MRSRMSLMSASTSALIGLPKSIRKALIVSRMALRIAGSVSAGTLYGIATFKYPQESAPLAVSLSSPAGHCRSALSTR